MHHTNPNEIGLYIYSESIGKKIVYKEKLLLPNKQIIDLDFLSIINAIINCSMFSRHSTIQGIIDMFYEKIDPEINKYFNSIRESELDNPMARLVNALNGSGNAKKLENIILLPNVLGQVPQHPKIDLDLIGFYGEIYFVSLAIKKWLSNTESKKMPLERFSSVWTIAQAEIYRNMAYKAYEVINMIINNEANYHDLSTLLLDRALYEFSGARTRQFHTETRPMEARKKLIRSREGGIITKDTQVQYISSKFYSSGQGILPLLWSEIIYCLDNNLSLKQCKECNNWFLVNLNEKYCSKPCQKQAKKKQDDNRYLRRREEKKNAQEERK